MNPMQEVEVLRAACCVAGIDGKITEDEMAMINKLAARAGVGRASLEAMVARGESDPEFYKEQFRVLKENPRRSMVDILRVATADRVLSNDEIGVMRKFAEKLNISPESFDAAIDKVSQRSE
ncbi:TerB family tellurite resistance protein [bacterium]|mgnify:CR=1 FL=1|jgi:tellurite resistance protein|nr:TerB family tellurite resistance protein [Mariniblastus sp.]MDB4391969.1 TerB family tellurite resistance protein [bacterium]MDA7906778.1 TerB family tellurite resistance protein [Mariniblastus sp.]MDB4372344.1 TerB family tellurite resistance protein [Mariniblastus sp.]MDB4379957.1 TerB family tellurite resistance protein [Mariniblastus sp.]